MIKKRSEWREWEGKNCIIKTTNKRIYTGSIIKVIEENYPLIYIKVLGKFNEIAFISSHEIEEIREEIKL